MINILDNTVIVNKTEIPMHIEYMDITMEDNTFNENSWELDMNDSNKTYFLTSKPENFWGMVVTNISYNENTIFSIDESYINTQQILLDAKVQYEIKVKEEQARAEQERLAAEQERIRLEQERLAWEEQKRIQLEQELKKLGTAQTTLDSLFPPSIVTGTMLYNVGGFLLTVWK